MLNNNNNKKKNRECEAAPILSYVDELIGKNVGHYFFLEDEDELWKQRCCRGKFRCQVFGKIP